MHVRDTLSAPADASAAEFARPVFRPEAGTTVHEALEAMRETRNHLAVVTDGHDVQGVVSLADVLRRLLPEVASRT